jgi:ABC-type polysaccharide/polyol phosphate export permease
MHADLCVDYAFCYAGDCYKHRCLRRPRTELERRILHPRFILLATFSFTLGYLLTALTPFARNINQATQIIFNALFFMTSIVYPPTTIADAVPTWARLILLDANP